MKKLFLCLVLLMSSAFAQNVTSHPPIRKATIIQTSGETVSCFAASLPTAPQPVIEDGFMEYKFFMTITPAANSGPISQHEIDCGTYTIPFDTVFNIAKTTLVFGTLQGGDLSMEMELSWPDGRERTFYESGEALATVTSSTTAVHATPSILSTPWPPFTFHVLAGTTLHFAFNYSIPDPQHTCNPNCTIVGNAWLMGNN